MKKKYESCIIKFEVLLKEDVMFASSEGYDMFGDDIY